MDNPTTPKTEQLPHSGNLPDSMVEKPVEESNIPLAEASLQQFASLNKDGQHPVEIDYLTANTTETEKTKPKYSLRVKLGAVATVVALSVGGYFGVKAVTDTQPSQPQDKDDKATSEVTASPSATNSPSTIETTSPVPVETQAPGTQPEGELTVASIEIPAGLSPEQYGKAFFEKGIAQWVMAGATQDNEMSWVTAGDDGPQYLETLTKANAKIFADALFTKEAQKTPEITKFIEGMTTNNRVAIEVYFKTDLLGQDAYTYKSNVDSTTVEKQPSGDKTYTTSETEYNNSADNDAGTFVPSLLQQNNLTFTWTYSTKVVDGKEKATSLTTK